MSEKLKKRIFGCPICHGTQAIKSELTRLKVDFFTDQEDCHELAYQYDHIGATSIYFSHTCVDCGHTFGNPEKLK